MSPSFQVTLSQENLSSCYDPVTSLKPFTFTSWRASLIVQTSHSASVSICPCAEAVNPRSVDTGAPAPVGSVPRAQRETVFMLLPGKYLFPPTTSYQNEYRGCPEGAQPTNPIEAGRNVEVGCSAWKATAEVKMAPKLTFASDCFDFA